ncbi:MAG: HU family DNA-binding protein [Prevotella sp.]|nr:HU family DNA-binding protein [Prevotella sp.]
MGKYSITQLATILVKKNGISNDEALKFVTAIFDIVKEGLETDKLVKIKGFGTFKIIDVDPRESVNVNTGERVLINGHQKITFTPDSVMKEMVNRPFAQFETVVLNDGVDFSDIDKLSNINENIDKQEETQEELQEIIQEEEEEKKEEGKKEEGKEDVHDITPQESSTNDDVVRNQTTISPTKELAETSTKETTEKLIEESSEKPIEEPAEKLIEELAEKPIEETAEKLIEEPAEKQIEEPAEDPIEDFDKEENSHNFTTILLSIASCLLLMAASAYIGYLYGIEEGRHQEKTSQISKYSTYLDKQNEELRTKRLAEEAKATKEAKKTKNDTTKQTAKDNKTDTTTNNQPKENNKTKEDNNDDNFSKYNTMDKRVRTGAYVIVGIDKYIIVREGQTVGKIAKALLGPGMSCYIEVLNGVTENEPLKEGTKIKIPKLRHKKAAKKK